MISDSIPDSDNTVLDPQAVPAETARFWDYLPYLAVLLAAVIGRLPAMGAWWHGQEWELLSQAGGSGLTGFPARLVGEHLWWAVTYPIFGLAAEPQTWLRILLHAGSALMVVRLAVRAGLSPLARLVAGLLFAGSPLAFASLYTAAGVQDLLAGLLALVAVDRWLAGGRRQLLLAFLCGILSMLSQELALGLPLFFTALLWLNLGPRLEDKAFAWALTLLLLLIAVGEGTLVLTQPGAQGVEPAAVGSLATLAANLGEFGWWLVSPGHILAGELTWTMTAAGGMLFVLWLAWSVATWRNVSLMPLVTLLGAVITLGPALFKQGNVPADAYLATAAVALGLASILPRKWNLEIATLLGLTILTGAWSFLGMQSRISARDVQGLPADTAVQATALSWQTSQQLRNLPLDTKVAGSTLILLQIPLGAQSVQLDSGLGKASVQHSPLYEAVGGTTGPSLQLGSGIVVRWANTLVGSPADALVLSEAPDGFRFWGRTDGAVFYAVLTDIGRGQNDRARIH